MCLMEPSILAFEPGLGTVRDSCRTFFNSLLGHLLRQDWRAGIRSVDVLATAGSEFKKMRRSP